MLVVTTTTATKRLADALAGADGVTVTTVDDVDDPAARLREYAGHDCVVCGDEASEAGSRSVPVAAAQHELAPFETDTETELEHTSGLGLRAADRIARDSGGTIELVREEPSGTTAIVRLATALDED